MMRLLPSSPTCDETDDETAAQQSYMCCEAAVQQSIYSLKLFVSYRISYLI